MKANYHVYSGKTIVAHVYTDREQCFLHSMTACIMIRRNQARDILQHARNGGFRIVKTRAF